MTETLTPAVLEALRPRARELGLIALGAVDLEHPGFDAARASYEAFLAAGKAGTMQFLTRNVELRKRPGGMLEGAQSLVVAAMAYRGRSATIARYAQAGDYHIHLRTRMDALGESLRELLPEARTLTCVDTKPVLERSAAVLAGIGKLGKHGCVIVPGYGSYVLLGALLCTAPVSESGVELEPGVFDICGSCTACLDECPTAAFDAPGQLDPRLCISYLTIEHHGDIEPELAGKIGERVAGCDLCQEVCPHNASPSRESRVPGTGWLPDVDVDLAAIRPADLLKLGSNQYKRFVRGTALNRIPRRAMRRNALIALANADRRLEPEELALVEAAESDRDTGVVRVARDVRTRAKLRDKNND